jgi:DNA-binding transcriptional MerR regulator
MKLDFSHILDGLSLSGLKAEATRLQGVISDRRSALEKARTPAEAERLETVIDLRKAKLSEVKERIAALAKTGETGPTVADTQALADRLRDLEAKFAAEAAEKDELKKQLAAATAKASGK